MKDYIKERTMELGEYIINNKATVREVGKRFNVSKSTVHKDVTERLKEIDYEFYLEVKQVLDFNLSERHIRGGISTRIKFKGQEE
ncbi:MAG: sporulation transcriptional regulator SpoIIID [Firmicutes bacterium]|nr:sporulation transcriptional regulator SpoIIID [Bacillota bacterium]